MKFNRGDIVKASVFTWSHGNGYAEASDLRDVRMTQIWSDSLDAGFSVCMNEHGALRTFVEFGKTRDAENELISIVFVSINEKTGRIDRPGGRITLTIYND